MTILVTGGTVFVSRYVAEYFVNKGHEVYVLNRNSKPQSNGVKLIKADRHNLGETLKSYHFDIVVDVTAYTKSDVENLLRALDDFDNYVMISSSAVYPENLSQPFKEKQECGENSYWGVYGTNKLEAEDYLQKNLPSAYILRPPYLYGKMNNLYREAFVFDCAEQNRPFYIPKDGKMPLQFFDVEDLCRFIEIVLKEQPEQHIFNVGNKEIVDIKEWVTLCYRVLGKEPELKFVDGDVTQRDYFPFLDYGYILDVTEQYKLMPDTKPLSVGLKESYEWYKNNKDLVRWKPLINYIDDNLND